MNTPLPAAALPRRHERRPRRRAAVLTAGVVAVATVTAAPGVVAIPAAAASEAPATMSIVINSTRFGGSDTAPGDRLCTTGTLTADGAHECTLRAAVEEANAVQGAPGTVSITVDESIAPGTRLTGTPTAADLMFAATTSSLITAGDRAAFLHLTAPMTLDLGHRLLADFAVPSAPRAAAFYVDAPDIRIRNSDQVLSEGTSFVVGPKAARVVIDGMHDGTRAQVSTLPRFAPERFVAFREGAEDVLVTGFDVSGFRSPGGAVFFFNNLGTPGTPMTRIVIDDVDVTYPGTTTCTQHNGSGCGAPLVQMQGPTTTNWSAITIAGLELRTMTVRGLRGTHGLTIGRPGAAGDTAISPKIRDLVIEDNKFLDTSGGNEQIQNSFLVLPPDANLQGQTSIRHNVFRSAGTGAGTAIYGPGTRAITNNTNPSGVTIANNHFDNFPKLGIMMYRMGLVTMTGNTFGARMRGSAGATEETFDLSGAAPSPGLVDNYHHYNATTTNLSLATWYPRAQATVLTTSPPAGSRDVAPHAGLADLPLCRAVVDVVQPPALASRTEPVTLDVYWTSGSNAEVYLGQITGVRGAAATLVVPVPVGTVPLPDGALVTPVDGSTGTASGRIRLQTHLEGLGQLASSQYSRTVPLTGTCQPVVAIDQAPGQADPTMTRDLRFTITSASPLDPASVSAEVVSVRAAATPETIDAARLNPRVVSVTQAAEQPGTAFDVVVRVDDSATVTVALDPDAQAFDDVLVGASTDPSITYLNPLDASPTQFVVVTGDPVGQSYAMHVRDGAPVPRDTLQFTSAVSVEGAAPPVTISIDSPSIAAGATTSEPVVVTAASGPVPPETPAAISASLTTGDPNYAGLVVPVVRPFLFAADPTVEITKRAYRDVGDTSSPSAVESSGTPVPSGSLTARGDAVCFVYTVTNTSRGRWETELSDLTVTDSDERLGDGGLVGTLPTLAPAESAQFLRCTVLPPPGRATSAPSLDDGQRS